MPTKNHIWRISKSQHFECDVSYDAIPLGVNPNAKILEEKNGNGKTLILTPGTSIRIEKDVYFNPTWTMLMVDRSNN